MIRNDEQPRTGRFGAVLLTFGLALVVAACPSPDEDFEPAQPPPALEQQGQPPYPDPGVPAPPQRYPIETAPTDPMHPDSPAVQQRIQEADPPAQQPGPDPMRPQQ
jgi:hypothetical protein